jgi:hypothetical protein
MFYLLETTVGENPFSEIQTEFDNEALIRQLEGAIGKSRDIAEAWDQIWQRSFHLVLPGSGGDVSIAGGWLFAKLCTLGFWLALFCVIFYGFSQYKYWLEGNYSQYLLSLLNPLVVVILLANNGALAVAGFELLRDIGNYANRIVLTGSLQGINLQNAFRLANASFGFKYAFNTQLQQCMAYSGDIQQACVNHLAGQADAMKEFLLKESIAGRYANSGLENVIPGLSQLFDPQFWQALGDKTNPLNMLKNDTEGPIFSFLKSLQESYQHLMEGALILMGYTFPLALGCLLLPVGFNVLLGWISGFIAIIIANLSYNGIVGLVATAAVLANPDDPLPFGNLLGVFAPVLASALAGGGGAAIWSGVSSATAGAVNAGFDVAGSAVGLGLRKGI